MTIRRASARPADAMNFSPQELAAYLEHRKVMVVDAGAYTGRSLQRILVELGMSESNIQVCRDFDEANLEIAVRRPQILFVDFDMGGQRGLELVETHEAQFGNRLEIASIVMNSHPTSASVGMITESNVDAVLIKPITHATAKSALLHALANKVKPSPYWSTLERGKEHLNRKELEEAMRLFEEAKSFDPAPTLSFYYLGVTRQKQKLYPEAGTEFGRGLDLDPKNYRCLNGFFDLRMECSEFEEAYELAQRLHASYPVNARRLQEFVRLSVLVRKYEDIVDYVKVYEGLENPDASTQRAVIAALLVAAKAVADRGDRVLARAVLKKASQISLRTEVLRGETFRYFLEAGDVEGGQNFYDSLPGPVRFQPEIENLYLEMVHMAGNSTETIQFGSQLIRAGKSSPRVHELVILHSRKMGRPDTVIGRLIDEAENLYPKVAWREITPTPKTSKK